MNTVVIIESWILLATIIVGFGIIFLAVITISKKKNKKKKYK